MDYKLLNISQDKLIEENRVIEKIKQCLDNNLSFFYNTGAGAGKTYALLQAIIYVIEKQGNELKNYNQNIVCITYTNVATNEIKERLGQSNIVLVSTIHTRIWDIISKYPKQLMKIHIGVMENEILKNKNFLVNDEKSEWYRITFPTDKDKNEFNEYFLLQLENYYSIKNKNTEQILKYIKDNLKVKFNNIDVKHKTHFVKTMDAIIKIHKFQKALESINSKIKVEYDIRYNYDRLDKFTITHETVLKYALLFIKEYPQIKDILIDKYPIVFIDEFQDTNEEVVSFLNELYSHAKNKGKQFCLGYFGDLKQNIYDTGIGNKAIELTKDYVQIDNQFNRRSSEEIIAIANNIRNDCISQQTIYDDFKYSNIKFVNSDFEHSMINEYVEQWNINKENKLYCLLMKNENVAEYNGFKNVYNAFYNYYTGAKYKQLSSELLSDDETKLGKTQLLIKRLIRFQQSVENNKTLVKDVLDIKRRGYTYNDLSKYIDKFRTIKGDTLREYIENFYSVLNENVQIISYILGDDYLLKEDFLSFLLRNLTEKNGKDNIDEILDLSIAELIQWYKYINREFYDKSVVYQTIHSAKGLEYDNTIVVLSDDFQIRKNYFQYFFEKYSIGKDLIVDNKYSNAQNLLYVAVTRAVKNLAIYYKYGNDNAILDNNIRKIFNIN